ncbi:MAG: hypothetical protein JSS16_12095 [Proteobacteria bacterium]|nr:hypothetical protein [Pseudomonadota bacterium]
MSWSRRFSVFGVVCALATGASYAQDLAIDGKDFESGAADAKLAEIARQAAASGKTVVVTTPPYWQTKVANKIRSVAPGVQVKTSDAFFENVLVRIVDGEKPAKSEPVATAPKPVEKVAEAAPVPKPAPRVETAPAVPVAPSTGKVTEAAAKAEPAQVAIARLAPAATAAAPQAKPPAGAAAMPAPSALGNASAPAVEVASISPPPTVAATRPGMTAADIAVIKHAFENQFNLGQPASGDIRPGLLRKGDEIFIRGPVRAVVRRERSRVQLFWVDGEINLERAELMKTDANRYRVDEPLRDVANPSLRAMHSEPKMFTAHIPAAKVRADMERHFNDAKIITARMAPVDLRYGDLFYVYRNHAVVFRRTELGFDRYWLEGEIDLNQSGVIKSGDAYRIVSEKL